MTDVKTLPKPLIDTIAGFFAGIASTLVGHPLDLLKTRLQGMPHLTLSDTILTAKNRTESRSRPFLLKPLWQLRSHCT